MNANGSYAAYPHTNNTGNTHRHTLTTAQLAAIRHAADAIAGGQWLGGWLTVTAAVANSGSFLSEMSVTSQTLIGMSERGLLPGRLMRESRHGTHVWALAVIAVFVCVSQPLDFEALVLVCEWRLLTAR